MTRRLLYVVNDTPYFVLHWLERALAARAHGYDAHVGGSAGPGVEHVTAGGLAFHPIPFIRGRANPVREAQTFMALDHLYRTLRPDLIHHITIKPVIYGGLVSRWLEVPAVVHTVPGLGYVFSQEGWRAGVQRAVVKRAYRSALAHPRSMVIFENPDDRADFVDWRLISERQSMVIKGAGVDLERFRPGSADMSGQAPTVVMAARLLWDKGVGLFVDAAALVKQAHPDARMVLVGDNDPASPASIPTVQLRRWAESGIVEWWGRRDDMPGVLAAATVVCLPSFYREGIPRVLIEAAACGRPIVTTDAAGCREIVRHGENGLLVPPKDADALARAIIELLNDPARRARMGASGRARAEAEYGSTHVVRQTLAVYDRLSAQEDPATP